ncbi:MAG TPA: type II toxin-antitoxin system HicA family toxin [Candidatus Tectomicrobia bacterium]
MVLNSPLRKLHSAAVWADQATGFEGPYSSGRHQFMAKGDLTIWIPSPHRADIGRELLVRILRQAHISRDEWEKL